MTSPERLLTDEQVADLAARAHLATLGVFESIAVRACVELIASRRLAPLHAAAVALADVVLRNADHWDANAVGLGAQQCIDAYRAARAALEPQSDEGNYAKVHEWIETLTKDQAAEVLRCIVKRAALGRVGK